MSMTLPTPAPLSQPAAESGARVLDLPKAEAAAPLGQPRAVSDPHGAVAWWREPLLHFAVLGAALFAVDHFLVSRADDPRTIVVASAVNNEAKTLFRSSRGRNPNAEELQALTRRWLDNEILYREGLALGVERGDNMIRERVIFKSLMLVESGLKLPAVDDTRLRVWFETQRARYDEPIRFDFQEAVLSDDKSESAARAFAQALNSGAPGDTKAGLRVFKGRPHDNLVQSYGTEFAKALSNATVGEWRVLPTSDGPRVMRLDAVTAPKPASFEPLRNAVLADWTDATMAQMRTDAVRARGQKYQIQYENAAP
jgi:PPIC-type PPIASE domain